MIVHFINGEKLAISQEVAIFLRDKICMGNAADFQIFANSDNQPFLFIRLSQINFISAT